MTKFRCIAVSDIHLGSNELDRQAFIEFLQTHEAENWVFVGDIINNLNLQKFTSQDVQILKIIRNLKQVANVYGVEGNHEFSGSQLKQDYLGRTYLYNQLLPISWSQELILTFSGIPMIFNHGHGFFEPNFWSSKIYNLYKAVHPFNKKASRQILKVLTLMLGKFGMDFSKKKALAYAKAKGYKVIIGGHTHIPGLYYKDKTLYANCGTWTSMNAYPTSTYIGITDRDIGLYNQNDVPLEFLTDYMNDEPKRTSYSTLKNK